MFKRLKPKSEFSRNVLTLMTGTSIAQAIPIAISPILTRIYTPEDFGVFALYLSVASIVSTMATGRYELAIMLPKKDEDAINIVVLSITISFFVSLLSLLIVSVFNTQIAYLLGNPAISPWLYFIPVSVLLTGLYQSFNYWSSRKKEYKRLAANRVVQSGVMASSNIGMGVGGFGASGFILSTLLGQGMATFLFYKKICSKDMDLFKYINKLKLIALLKKYKKLPTLNLPNALIDGVRLSGINILIAKFFTTAVLGQFSLAWKMVQTPMSLIGGSLSQVFFQKISSAKKSDLELIVRKFIIKIFFIAAPIFLILYFYSLDIFTFVFGVKWKLAGESASIMAPWLFLNFISSPISTVFIILNKQEILLFISVVYMIIPLFLILLLYNLGFLYILNLISISMSIVLLFFIGLAYMYIKREKNVI